MNSYLRNKIIQSIYREIKYAINEQFSVSDIVFSDDESGYDANIFNKTVNYIEIYNNILRNKKAVTADDIRYMNILVSEIAPKNKDELRKIIEFYSKKYSEDSLNWLDVSRITDMSNLFEKTNYNGDISKWDTSNVTDMSYMFLWANEFNQSIGDWDVSHVTNMECMFSDAKKFNQPIGDWDVSSVTDMSYMFSDAEKFNQPIGEWDVSNVKYMIYMFYVTENFNKPINDWDVSNVIDMEKMFYCASSFNQDISKWNISDETDIDEMFEHCPIEKNHKPKRCRYYNYE